MALTIMNTIPPSVQQAIEHYKNLRIGSKTVRCPYYRNPRSGKGRWGLNAYSGKGSWQEIEEELKIIEKLEGKNLDALSEDQVRDIMKKRHLGVECSGFIAHILDAWTRSARGKRIFHVLKFPGRGLYHGIAVWLRPFTHIDVSTLAHPDNAQEFSDIREIGAGDLIRFNTDIDHAILVTRVERDALGAPMRIGYVHSVREETGEGIKEGLITMQAPDGGLKAQLWQETPHTGHTIGQRGKPQLYHLRFLAGV